MNNFLDLCRFCLHYCGINDRNYLDKTIKDQFEYLTSEKVNKKVGSSFSCTSCLEKLRSAISTKEIFLRNQEILENKSPNVSDFLEEPDMLEVTIKEERIDDDATVKEELEPEVISSVKSKRGRKPKNADPNSFETPGKRQRKRGKQIMIPAPCEICGKVLSSKENLRDHVKTIHEGIRKFECDLCGHRFARKGKVLNHLKSHLKIRDIPCDDCDLFFTSIDHMKSHHMKAHQGLTIATKIACEICGVMCTGRIPYENHRRTHTGETPWICEEPDCGKKFKSKYQFAKHKQSRHSADALQTCPLCFKEVRGLKTHQRYVHGEKTVTCIYAGCNKLFITKSNMKEHYTTVHCDIKRFTCQYCNAPYKSRMHLKTHIYKNHLFKSIQCELCPTLLSSKSYYDKHIKSSHNLDYVTKENLLKKIRETPVEKLFNYQK